MGHKKNQIKILSFITLCFIFLLPLKAKANQLNMSIKTSKLIVSLNPNNINTKNNTNYSNKHNKQNSKNLTLEEKAKKFNVDITNLSEDEAIAKIKEARKIKVRAHLDKKAKELGVDISGLTNEEAIKKLKSYKKTTQ